MPSFTSSSKSSAAFYSKILVGVCVALIVIFEITSDYLLRHDSETYARVSQQYSQALSVRPAKPGESTPILIVGNSLLLEGIDVKQLQKLTAGRIRICPVFLEATGYYDWFYALRRLFREGARPPVVVIGVGVNNFLADSVREDYAPLMLFDLRDSFDVASDLKMDRTATSNLLLAHSSVFWDTRSVLRTQILRHTIPHYRELVLLLKAQPSIPPVSVFDSIANLRLQRLRDLCHSYGAKLILLIPPTPSSGEAVRRMTLAAQNANVEALVPIDPEVLPVEYYQSDRLHLNSQGAALFTSALAIFLSQRMDHQAIVSPG